jgi:hypothetical protein
MTIVPFGLFEPDKAGLNTDLVSVARNALRKANSYGPVPSLADFGFPALAARCRGLGFARTESGGWLVFAGTATKLYQLVAGAWVDRTRTSGGDYAVPDGELWNFTQFGSILIASQSNDDHQRFDVDSGASAFTALGGSPPKARKTKVIGDFLHVAGMPTDPKKARWSSLNNCESWTLGSQFADEQPFESGGRLMDVHGDKRGVFLQEQCVRVFEFQPGSDYVYVIALVDGVPGCIAPYGSASFGPTAFYLAEGTRFFSISFDGSAAPIGATRVDEWFQRNTDPARASEVVAIADPVRPYIYWAAYASAASTDFDILLPYNWQLDMWSPPIHESAQVWASVAAPGKTLEELDDVAASLEDLPSSLDAPEWQGDKPSFGGINPDGNLSFMSGPALEAVLETAEIGGTTLSIVTDVTPLDGADGTLRIGSREKLTDAVTYSEAYVLEETGKFAPLETGRYHRFERTIPAGSEWTHAQGLDVMSQPDGDR